MACESQRYGSPSLSILKGLSDLETQPVMNLAKVNHKTEGLDKEELSTHFVGGRA